MKTPEEKKSPSQYLKDLFKGITNIEEHQSFGFKEVCTYIENYAIYAAQFQSQPSISAEEFLKEKGIYETLQPVLIDTNPSKYGYRLVELLTEFASRQGKVVEIEDMEASETCGCPNCEENVKGFFNFCPNCGSKIKWIN